MKKLKKKYLLISLLILIIPIILASGITVWDDCEDLNNEGAVWAGIRGDETVINSATSKYGTNAILIKGGTIDSPAASLWFDVTKDWSDYESFEIWLAPNDDDSTPAINKVVHVNIYSTGAGVQYFQTLSNTPDEYILKKCEINSSGVGDSLNGSFGVMNWSDIIRVVILLADTTDNIDMAYDHVTLTYYKPYQVNWGIWTQFTLIGTIIYSGIFIMLVSVFYIMIVGK